MGIQDKELAKRAAVYMRKWKPKCNGIICKDHKDRSVCELELAWEKAKIQAEDDLLNAFLARQEGQEVDLSSQETA